MEGQRQGPYDRVPVAMSPPSDVCPFCRWPLDRWVQIRLGKKRCHVLLGPRWQEQTPRWVALM